MSSRLLPVCLATLTCVVLDQYFEILKAIGSYPPHLYILKAIGSYPPHPYILKGIGSYPPHTYILKTIGWYSPHRTEKHTSFC